MAVHDRKECHYPYNAANPLLIGVIARNGDDVDDEGGVFCI